ncbi:class I SAM-dependent methyltransferase [Arthrospira platensis SPKY2]
MRKTTGELLRYYIEQMNISGKALEIGGHKLSKSASQYFPFPRFEYYDLNLDKSDIPNTIIADITDANNIDDNSFDIIFSSDVFEHINRPWLAAQEIERILKPGGIVVTVTLWSWRNHPCPIDYWRFSPECLEFLFGNLQTIEKGYDLSQRRKNQLGFWKSGLDAVPIDAMGGWRENWAVYHVAGKEILPSRFPPPFKSTNNGVAKYLRMDVQGKIDEIKRQRARCLKEDQD